MLVLSGGGNISNKTDPEETKRSLLLLELLGKIGLDAVAVQDADLRFGVDSLQAMGERWGLPFLCANLQDPQKRTVFPGWRVIDAGAEKVGIVAATDTRLQNERFLPPGYRFADPLPYVAEGVRELREQEGCTLIVLLFGGRKDAMEKVLEKVDGVDLAYYGNAGNSMRRPSRTTAGTFVTTTGSRGKDYSELTLERNEAGELEIDKYVVHELTKEYSDDPEMKKVVDAFMEESRERKRRQRLIEEIARQNSSMETSENFMGTVSCKECHIREFEIWSENPHASAMASLEAELQDTNPDCVGCHVTGWGLPGGYGLNAGNRQLLANVQCEACHGYGSEHSRGEGNLRAARESCTRCHDAEMSPDFDFASYWERIHH